MAIDVFDREVKASIDDLKAALLKDVGDEKKSAQKTDENTEELKKLNKHLAELVGQDLDRELKALGKLTKRVAESYEEISDKRSSDKQAKAIGKAVADSIKTVTFGEALEKSQRKFGAAFSEIGKQFQKDFGSIGERIKDGINRANPFKKMEEQSEAASNKFFSSLSDGWAKTSKFFQDNWQGLTKRISDFETAAINKVVSGWNYVSTAVGNTFVKVIDSMAGFWQRRISPTLQTMAIPFKWFGKYLIPIGKALFDSSKAFLSVGKKSGVAGAGKGTGDIAGGTSLKEMTGEGTPIGGKRGGTRVGGGSSDLCRCICRCISKLTGVTIQDAKASRKDAKAQATQSKGIFGKLFGGLFGKKTEEDKKGKGKDKEKVTRKPTRMESQSYWQGTNAAQGLTSLFSGSAIDDIGRGIASIIGRGFSGLGMDFMSGFVENLLGALIKPLKDQIQLQADQLQIIWSQTGGSIEDAEKELVKFRVTGEDVFKVGVDQVKIQKQLMRNAQKGIKDQKELRRITNSGLSLSSQIGSNAEQTADLFADWKLNLGLSNFQMGSIARGTREVAKATGVTGDNLLNVLKSSEQFLKNMRSAGTLSATAANNITGILARGQKTGTSEVAQRVVAALSTSSLKNMPDATRNLQTIFMRRSTPEQQRQYMGGTAIKHKDTINLGADNLEDLVREITGRNLEDISDIEAGMYSAMTESLIGEGMGIEAIRIQVKNMREEGKSYETKLSELNTQLGKSIKGSKKEEAIQKEIDSLKLGKSNDDLENFMKTMNSAEAPNIAKTLEERIGMLGEKAGKLGTTKPPETLLQEANDAIKAGNKEAFKDVIEKIQDLEMEADTRENLASNPVKAFQLSMEAAIADLKNVLADLLKKMLPELSRLALEMIPVIIQIGKDIATFVGSIDSKTALIVAGVGAAVVAFGLLVTTIGTVVGAVMGAGGLVAALTGAGGLVAALGLVGIAAAAVGLKIHAEKTVTDMTAPQMAGINKIKADADARAKIATTPENIAKLAKLDDDKIKELEEKLAKSKAAEKPAQELIELERKKYANKGLGFGHGAIEKNFQESEAAMRALQKRNVEEEQALKIAKMMRGKSPEQQQAIQDAFANIKQKETEFGKLGAFDIAGQYQKRQEIQSMMQDLEKGKISPMPAPGTVTPMLPNTGANMEDEARRKKAEIQNADKESMTGIESNTGATAAGVRGMTKMLGQIGRMLSKRLKNSDLAGVGPESSEVAFFEEVLSTEWPNARIGRKVGLEFDYSDIS